MIPNFSRSSPSYYTPKRRPQTAAKLYPDSAQKSTAQKYYDLEESFKQYEQLLQQNLELKNLLRQDSQPNNSPIVLRRTLFKQSQNDREQLSRKHRRNSSTKCLSTNAFNQSFSNDSRKEVMIELQNQNDNDILLWSVRKRNDFLQQKLMNLQRQYIKQNKTIQKIVNSEKWKNRFDCKERSCYQDKYLKLLRIRSPVLFQ